MNAGWFRLPEWKTYFDLPLSSLVEDVALLRVKDPSFNAVFNEIKHLADPFDRTLVRRQPAASIPEPGDILDINWELFHEDMESGIREPGDGPNTLLLSISKAHTTIPADENEHFVNGKFQVETVIPAPGSDGLTFIVWLREAA